jgi:hypothetical protein
MRPLAIALAVLSACSSPDKKDDSRRAPPPSPEPAVPELSVPYIAKGEHKSMMIDGELAEMQWQHAAQIDAFVEPGSGAPVGPGSVKGSAQLFWDEAALYIAIWADDRDVRGGFPADAIDPHLWERDTVEVMLDPDGDGDNRDYYEIQVNPQNLVFDSQFDGYNAPRTEPSGPFGHEEWASGIKSGVVVHGTLDDSSDVDRGYTVEMAIPWTSLTKAKVTPPRAGDTWRANFYAMEDNGGAAWSPILNKGNFHRASRFGRLHFDRR